MPGAQTPGSSAAIPTRGSVTAISRPPRAHARSERVSSRSREVLDEAAGYVRDRRETFEREKERLAAAVDAGRQKYREEKDKDKT